MNLASARTQIVADSTLEIESVLASVAAVENRSKHLIARVLTAAAEHAKLSLPTLENFESVTDYDVRASLGNIRITMRMFLFSNNLLA